MPRKVSEGRKKTDLRLILLSSKSERGAIFFNTVFINPEKFSDAQWQHHFFYVKRAALQTRMVWLISLKTSSSISSSAREYPTNITFTKLLNNGKDLVDVLCAG